MNSRSGLQWLGLILIYDSYKPGHKKPSDTGSCALLVLVTSNITSETSESTCLGFFTKRAYFSTKFLDPIKGALKHRLDCHLGHWYMSLVPGKQTELNYIANSVLGKK